jgi:hypothetical protein
VRVPKAERSNSQIERGCICAKQGFHNGFSAKTANLKHPVCGTTMGNPIGNNLVFMANSAGGHAAEPRKSRLATF